MKITREESVTNAIKIAANDAEGDAIYIKLLDGMVYDCQVKTYGKWLSEDGKLLQFAIEHRDEFYQLLKEIDDVKAKQQL